MDHERKVRISHFRITDSEIFNFRVKIIVVLTHMDSGVSLFKIYKLWDTLGRFGPGGIHTFKMNRSGPWRLGKHETIDLRVSKLISRDLCQFWPPKTHFKRSTESENTHNMYPEPSHSKTMCVWIGRDTILPHLYFWWILYMLNSKRTRISPSKNILFN